MAVLKDLIVHGASRFINNTHYVTAQGGVLAADKGVFNKLIATNAEIDTLNVDELNANNLTAQNATVMGLLDVKGDLHTNTWTNSNIATIQGNFYIAPTIKTGTSSDDDDTGVTISAISNGSESVGYWTLTISGTQIFSAVPDLESDSIDNSDSAFNSWSSGSLVMVTGSIKKGHITYPLGTLKGELSGDVGPNGVTITKITDNINNNPSTLQEYGAGTYGFAEIQVSLYKRKYNTGLYPLGILMSAQGRAAKTFIDIYGGGNQEHIGAWDGASTDYGGLALPHVRIGNLRGLPNTVTNDFTNDNGCLPTGWGIYTDNGYFKGTVVANSGNIGGAEIINGRLQVTEANITSISANKISVNKLSALTSHMGLLSAGRIQSGQPNQTGFMFMSPEDYATYVTTEDIEYNSSKTYYTRSGDGTDASPYVYTQFTGTSFVSDTTYYEFPYQALAIGNSGFKTDWRLILGNSFGVDSSGSVYATGAKIQGDIEASTFKVVNGGITFMTADSNGIIIGQANGFHLEATATELGFFDNQSKVAYINDSSLFINKSVVVSQMDIGFPFGKAIPSSTTNEEGKGQWSWKVHLNSETTPRNNLYLKWVG